MTLVSVLVYFAFAICPIVAVVFIAFYCVKRDPLSQPSVVAAIPLGLSSIAILLGQSAVVLLATFQQIATQRMTGVKAVVAGLLRAQRPLSWGLLEVAACLAAVLLVSVVLRYLRDSESPAIHAYIALPALIITAVVVVGLFLMVYLQYSTVDLVMMIVDTHRNQELTAQFGTVPPAYFASRISSHLVLITFLSIAEFWALLIAGGLSLGWRQKENARGRFAMMLAIGTLVACGAGALSEFGFVDYLLHLRKRGPELGQAELGRGIRLDGSSWLPITLAAKTKTPRGSAPRTKTSPRSPGVGRMGIKDGFLHSHRG